MTPPRTAQRGDHAGLTATTAGQTHKFYHDANTFGGTEQHIEEDILLHPALTQGFRRVSSSFGCIACLKKRCPPAMQLTTTFLCGRVAPSIRSTQHIYCPHRVDAWRRAASSSSRTPTAVNSFPETMIRGLNKLLRKVGFRGISTDLLQPPGGLRPVAL